MAAESSCLARCWPHQSATRATESGRLCLCSKRHLQERPPRQPSSCRLRSRRLTALQEEGNVSNFFPFFFRLFFRSVARPLPRGRNHLSVSLNARHHSPAFSLSCTEEGKSDLMSGTRGSTAPATSASSASTSSTAINGFMFFRLTRPKCEKRPGASIVGPCITRRARRENFQSEECFVLLEFSAQQLLWARRVGQRASQAS